MITLNSLSNTHRKQKTSRRVGRGTGCKKGKTCGRGHKGDGSRSGYKRRFGYEGGRMRLFMRLPIRGFSRARFKNPRVALNLSSIEEWFSDGDKVNLQTLQQMGYISKEPKEQLRILSQGELKKKVTIEAHYLSPKAIEKLQAAKISYTVITS